MEIPFNRRHVRNSDHVFFISKDPDSEWVLRGVEVSPGDFSFVEESIKRDWHSNEGPLLTDLTKAFGKDPRLMTNRNRGHKNGDRSSY